MNAAQAAKWHREEAIRQSELARSSDKVAEQFSTAPAFSDDMRALAAFKRDAAAAHDLAAKVLEALAVPGVAELLKIADRWFLQTPLTTTQRAAFRALADAAREGT